MPPPPFHETTLDPSEPRGERAKFTRGTQGISGAVVYWWTAPLWLGTRGQGMTPEACCVLWCLCVFVHAWDYVCVGICMCFSLRVFGGLFANVTVKPETDFLAFWSHMTAWSIIFSSTRSAIVFSCVGVSVTFITTLFVLILHSFRVHFNKISPLIFPVDGVFLVLFGYPIILSSRTVYLITTFAAMLGIMC